MHAIWGSETLALIRGSFDANDLLGHVQGEKMRTPKDKCKAYATTQKKTIETLLNKINDLK